MFRNIFWLFMIEINVYLNGIFLEIYFNLGLSFPLRPSSISWYFFIIDIVHWSSYRLIFKVDCDFFGKEQNTRIISITYPYFEARFSLVCSGIFKLFSPGSFISKILVCVWWVLLNIQHPFVFRKTQTSALRAFSSVTIARSLKWIS